MNALRFDIRLWFASASLTVIAALSISFALLMDRFISEHMVAREAEVAGEFLTSILRAEGSRRSAFTVGVATPEVLSFARHVVSLPGVLRANVYTLDGTILWSSDSQLIGRRYPDNEELIEASKGEPVVEFGRVGASDTKEEHVALDERDASYFIEAYIPLQDAEGEIAAVVELYQLPEALERTLAQARRAIWTSTGIGGLILFLTLWWIVDRGGRRIAQQETEIGRMRHMADLGRMASAVAHSLRNPLANIRSSVELMALDSPDTIAHAEVVGEVDRLERHVRELSSYAHGPPPALQAVDPHALISAALNRCQPSLERHNITSRVDDRRDRKEMVQADPTLLGHSLDTVLENAIEATSDRGRIEITIETLPRSRMVRIAVADNGEGISSEVLARFGEPFVTTKTRGLGIGPAVAKGIVERFGGQMDAQAGADRGTVIRIDLLRSA